MNFKFYSLNELVKIKYGKNQKKVENPNGNYPIYGTGGLMGYADEFLYDKPSVLIGRKGSINKVKYADKPFWTVDTLFYTEVNESKVLPKYLYYLMSRMNLSSYNEGTSIPSLRTETLYKIDLSIPSIQYQKQILKILNSIDSKIKVNTMINNNLQRLIKNIIDFYFEKFIPFSNENMIESEIGLIPETWNIFKMKDIVKVLNGYSYKGSDLSESNIAMATIKNFDRNGGFKTDGFKEIIISDRVKPHHFLNLFDVILACTDLTQNADIIGNAEILLNKSEYGDIVMSMDLIKIESKIPEIGNYILHALLSTKRFKYHALGYVNGTTVLHMDKKAIPNYKLALPNDFSILEYINNILKPLYQSMSKNIHEIEKLTKLRDTLLPKLMSGELDVTNIDINFDLE